MTSELFLVCLLGGLIAIDTTAAFQILLSHPLVGCTIVGLVLNDVTLGLSIGIILELPWLLEIPTGGARYPQGNLGAFIAAASVIVLNRQTDRSELAFLLAIVYGIALAYISGKCVQLIRNINILLVHRADQAASLGLSRRVSLYHLAGIILIFIMGMGITGLSVYFGIKILILIMALIPSRLDVSLVYTKPILLGVGLAAMVKLFYHKKMYLVIAFGICCGAVALYFVT